jgi:uncharacterized protein DUF4157
MPLMPPVRSKVRSEAISRIPGPEPQPQRDQHPGTASSEGLRSARIPGKSAASIASPVHPHFVGLQKAIGNQAVLRMLNRPTEPQLAAPSSASGFVLQRKCACGGSSGECESCKEMQEQGEVQRKSVSASPSSAVPPIVNEVLRSPGHHLDAATRAFFEPRFGNDFSDVRVHIDNRAAESARSVGASAYTVGKGIAFATGQYAPGTTSGQLLIAHELAHTIQQGGANSAGTGELAITPPDHATEREADRLATRVVAPAMQFQVELPKQQAPSLARQVDGGGDGGTDAGVPPTPAAPAPQNICGPDITSALSTAMGNVDTYFHGLRSWHKRRSCMVLDPDALLAFVNPGMAWDVLELFLPNTDFLDTYFLSSGCGSPRDPGCDTDPERHLCETKGTCGNTVIVGGKCMLAGTANYALYGKMFKLCNDEFSPDYPRWDMRAMIRLWKAVNRDDSGPPLAMASAAFDGSFPAIPAAAENRGLCTGRCGVTHAGSFDFVWEPYKPRP